MILRDRTVVLARRDQFEPFHDLRTVESKLVVRGGTAQWVLIKGVCDGSRVPCEWARDRWWPDPEVSSNSQNNQSRPMLRDSEVGEVDDFCRNLVAWTGSAIEELAGRPQRVSDKKPCLTLIRREEAWNVFEQEGLRLPLIEESRHLAEEVPTVRLGAIMVPE
jgi:hypothetical protein